MNIERYAYINTSSERGRPSKVIFDADSVKWAFVWTNGYGNPSYTLYLEDGSCLFLVDDYGAMNDINHLSAKIVRRKKDLF